MKMNSKSKRKVLGSLLVVGVVAAAAGSTTMALFSDSEESVDNSFSAGAVDLKVGWSESYNGEQIEMFPGNESETLGDNPGPIFEISDVKPGDHGEATVSLLVFDNPSYVWMQADQTGNFENGCSEPESHVDESCANPGAGEGELGEHLTFTIWHDDGDNVQEENETVIFSGTADELDNATAEGTLLDADPSSEGTDAFTASTTQYVGISWELPADTGNEVQTDSKVIDFAFYAEQERNNDNPLSPWM